MADLPSGRLNLKVPRSLHADLKKRALDEDVSLNQLVAYLLAMGLSEWEREISESQEGGIPRRHG